MCQNEGFFVEKCTVLTFKGVDGKQGPRAKTGYLTVPSDYAVFLVRRMKSFVSVLVVHLTHSYVLFVFSSQGDQEK